MSGRMLLVDLPFWPRYLSREEAARYLGVGVDVFVQEVAAGLWPAPRLRGNKGGRLTWDRLLLDATADRDSGIGVVSTETSTLPSPWKGRSDGPTPDKRTSGRS